MMSFSDYTKSIEGHKEVAQVTEEERKAIQKLIMEFASLPRSRKEWLMGYAEGVADGIKSSSVCKAPQQ